MKQPELIIEDIAPQDRQFRATETELRELADDIHKHGLKWPIVVMDGVIVDGLKRIEAFKLLGRARIPALTSLDFGEVALYLEKVRGEEELETRRSVELVVDIDPWRIKWHNIRAGLRRPTPKGPGRGTPSRILMARAVGRTESWTEVLQMILKRRSDPEILKRIEGIMAGVETVHATYAWIIRRERLGHVPTVMPDEVRATMARGIRSLATTLAAISKFGGVEVLTMEEREQLLKEFGEHRINLYKLTKDIKQGLEREKRDIDGQV